MAYNNYFPQYYPNPMMQQQAMPSQMPSNQQKESREGLASNG